MRSHLSLLILSLASQRTHGGRSSDYFTGGFDSNKNCLKDDLMKNLTEESYPRCAAVVGGWSNVKSSTAPSYGFQNSYKEMTMFSGNIANRS